MKTWAVVREGTTTPVVLNDQRKTEMTSTDEVMIHRVCKEMNKTCDGRFEVIEVQA